MLRLSLKFLVVSGVLGFVSNEVLKTESRQPKIFTFNADSEDVEVGFDFSIPFLKIPIKKTLNAVGQFGFPGIGWPKINIDPSALILGGFLIVTTSIFAPLLHKATTLHHLDRSSRKAFENETDPNLYIAEKLLSKSRGCPERIACWSTQRTKNPEVIKALKHIMRNKLLSSMVNTTALEIATAKGRSGQNCELYIPCPIEEKNLPKIIDSLTVLTNFKTRG
ncbi:uncharacterized protein LOC112046451 [Bicyclus anynana]|uniref:Uncharacterized protein LOC112046451 n=1 Tax=Bicyclus anynana TaxID=110368 RepID=A0A6J1MT77_BICAN|nr:uncharacterized protein LOC112046451 [Bicyclus anynana]